MGGDDELWQDLERSDLADFVRSTFTQEPTLDLTLPDYLQFSSEQRAFIASLVSHVVEDLTYELSHRWARHMIDFLVAGDWRSFDDVDHAPAPEPRDSPGSP